MHEATHTNIANLAFDFDTHMLRKKLHITILAQLLLLLVTGTLLVKPLHSLQHTHNYCKEEAHAGIVSLNAEHHSGCPICDFEFFQVIKHSSISLPKPQVFPFPEKKFELPLKIQTNFTFSFLLRGPPALS